MINLRVKGKEKPMCMLGKVRTGLEEAEREEEEEGEEEEEDEHEDQQQTSEVSTSRHTTRNTLFIQPICGRFRGPASFQAKSQTSAL